MINEMMKNNPNMAEQFEKMSGQKLDPKNIKMQ